MNFLVDIIPPKARRYVYGAAALAALIFGAWQASEGDWKTAVTSLLGSTWAALAHANTTEPQEPAK